MKKSFPKACQYKNLSTIKDKANQISIGQEIVHAYPEIYMPQIIHSIKQNLQSHTEILSSI